MLLVLALVVLVLQASSSNPDRSATNCDFEVPCAWQSKVSTPPGFRLVTGPEANQPPTDANNDTEGEYGTAISPTRATAYWTVLVL